MSLTVSMLPKSCTTGFFSNAVKSANGIRCFYLYLREAGHTRAQELSVETLSGVVRPRWAGARWC